MRVVLAGFGQEGKASYDYWNVDGNELAIADERDSIADLPDGVPTITGADAFSKLSDFDLIVRSPGINPKKLPYPGKVWSATNEFFEKCPAQIIGVTGTKGKGTTSSLIASILKSGGRNVHLVGNIGVPAVTELASIGADDVVVYELSSFQLWDIKRSPHIAVLLPIEPDHLDVHDSLEDYVQAKMNLVRYLNEDDLCIAHHSYDFDSLPDTDAGYWRYPDTDTVYVEDEWFRTKSTKLCPVESLRLPGAHNIENASAAIIAASYMLPGEQAGDMEAIFSAGLRSFEGLPHRLKYVAEKNGVKFYDDSIATTPGSAIAAINSFEQPKILILGGHDKGADYTELITLCAATGTKVLAIGANGDVIAATCERLGATCERETGDMVAIVHRTREIAQPGDVVVLSPAAASFDMFKSYADRGDQFIAAVTAL